MRSWSIEGSGGAKARLSPLSDPLISNLDPPDSLSLIHPPPAPNPNTRGCSCDAPAAVVSALPRCSQVSFKKTMRYFLGSICYGSILITLMQVRTSSQRCTLRCGHAAPLLRLR